MYGSPWPPMNDAVNHMTVTERLAELERQHKALEHEIAEALGQTSIDDLKITELKRRKLMLRMRSSGCGTIMRCERSCSIWNRGPEFFAPGSRLVQIPFGCKSTTVYHVPSVEFLGIQQAHA
jgi:hypothetical protein